MGMFDGLRGKLKKFGEQVEEEVAKEIPPEVEDEIERVLAEIEAEVAADREIEGTVIEEEPEAPPAPPAPPEPAASREPRTPEPRAPPAAEPVAEPAPPRAPEPKPAPPAAPREQPAPKPAPAPAPEPPKLRAPAPAAPASAPPPAAAAPPAEMSRQAQQIMQKGVGIKAERIQDLLWDLELMLLESDIAMEVVEAIKAHLERTLPTLRVRSSAEVQPAVEQALRDALREVLSAQVMDFDDLLLGAKKPYKIMFVGVNGTGKTTTIARIAHRLKQNGYTSVLAAGDTFRAGAIEQIGIHSERLGLTVVKHSAGADPAAVAHDAIDHAVSRRKDVVLIDTAGRMQTNLNLMDEMKKIKRVAQPDLVVFVGDALAGNDAVEQAKKFDQAVHIDAAILTKVDTDSKGGAALSIAHAVGKPILFLGVGQEYDDLIPFDPDWVVDRIFGE